MTHRRSRTTRFILDNSLLLLAGTVAAVAWANINHNTYGSSSIRCTSG